VRFVAATNCPPDEMITGKELRADLYYRLRGFEIEVPPLRERREDLPHLARHFLPDDDPGITPAALDALARHEWPGNVRELRNVLRSARARAAGRPIDVQHLELAAGGRPAPSSSRPPTSDTLPAKRLDEVERDVIARTLAEQGHNLSRAALALGIHRSTLRRKLAQLGLRNEALLRGKKS
jgi:DNA-binding NtrC family response regulator